MFGRYLFGWVLVTICYFFTGAGAASLYRQLYEQPVDHNWDLSGMFIGSFLLVVPYIFAGIYARWVPAKPVLAAFWLSSIPVVSERILIYAIGAWLGATGGDGSMDGVTTMMFIRGEAAPYYTVTYILLGVFSIFLAMITAAVGGVWSRDGASSVHQSGRPLSRELRPVVEAQDR